jgi:hypothetical protein
VERVDTVEFIYLVVWCLLSKAVCSSGYMATNMMINELGTDTEGSGRVSAFA